MSGLGALLWVALAAEPLTAPVVSSTALTIEQAVDLALSRDERAAASREEEKAAQARLWQARAFFFPELEASGSWTHRPQETVATIGGREVVLQSQDAVETRAVASLTLFDARAFPAWRSARKARDAARLEGADTRRGIAFETAEAFLVVLGVQRVREAAERRVALAEAALRDARARFEAKLVGVNDVTRAELDLANATRDLTRARGDVELSRLNLGFLLGADLPPALAPPSDLLERARETPVDGHDLDSLPERRADVLAARRRAEAARATARIPLAGALPSVSANATWRTTNETGLSGREEDWWLGATATWTIFDGGERYGERRELKALARIAELQASALERRARLALEQARIGVESARAAFAAARAEVDAAVRNERETSALYEQGLASALEATTARVSLFEAEVALVREEYGLAAAYLAVPEALGQDPFGKDIVSEATR